MTDSEDRAARLAQLQARRAQRPAVDRPTRPASGAGDPPTSPATRPRQRPRRRPSPAAGAKVVAVGASTTAMLGMIAAFGVAARAQESSNATTTESVAADDLTPVPPATLPSTVAPAPSTGVASPAATSPPASSPSAPQAVPAPNTTSPLQPVAPSTAVVELAVPPVPVAAPAPAPSRRTTQSAGTTAAAPAPAPAPPPPQATSGGS